MNKKYVVLAICFIVIGLYIIFANINDSSNEKDTITIRVTPDNPMSAFECKAKEYYSIATTGFIHYIYINGERYEDKSPVRNCFTTSFNEDTYIRLDFNLDGVYFHSGKVYISKGHDKDYPYLILLKPKEYSHFKIPISAEQFLDIPQQNEYYHAGCFKDEKFNSDIDFLDDTSFTMWVWEDYGLKFRSAEIPFLFYIPANTKPYYKNFTVRGNETTYLPRAYFLKKGSVINTPIWLDKGDHFDFNDAYDKNLLYKLSEKDRWREADQRDRSFMERGNAYMSGYLRVKAKSSVVFDKFSFSHRTKWNFELKPGQSKKIKVYKGDVLSISSWERFFVDDYLCESRDCRYTADADGYVQIKQSIKPSKINVSVVKRRCH